MWRILCYHGVSPSWRNRFRDQLVSLQDGGWTFVGVSEGIEKLRSNSSGLWMSVTFDDGDSTVMDAVASVLQPLAIPACVYVTTDFIQRGRIYRNVDEPALNWREIRELRSGGHEIGSHTHTHAPLVLCTPERLSQELAVSKDILEQELGSPVIHFSYPWGQFDVRTQQEAELTKLYETYATIDRGSMKLPTNLLNRDLAEPTWTPARLQTYLSWGDTPFYEMRKLLRLGRGYWSKHPEETWTRLDTLENEVTKAI
jgi:peptidoglycan/xylan/chitin deacetylase (PgdA/CDA1 family)